MGLFNSLFGSDEDRRQSKKEEIERLKNLIYYENKGIEVAKINLTRAKVSLADERKRPRPRLAGRKNNIEGHKRIIAMYKATIARYRAQIAALRKKH